NPKRPTPPLPQRTVAHEAHRESPVVGGPRTPDAQGPAPPSGLAGAAPTDIPHPTLEAKPPLRAPAFALRGPLPDDPVELWGMGIGACARQHRRRILVDNMPLLKGDNALALLQVAEELPPPAAGPQQELSTLLSTPWGQPVRVEIESLAPPGLPPAA